MFKWLQRQGYLIEPWTSLDVIDMIVDLLD